MSIKLIKTLLPSLVTVVLLTTSSAKASYVLNSYSAIHYWGDYTPPSSNSLLFDFGNDGRRSGLLSDSYNCYSGLTSIHYAGGNYADGICLVLKDTRGNCYVWNITDWNGTDQIDCNINSRYFDCTDIKIYGNCRTTCNPPPTCVPEPSTVLAGAILLIPLGVQTVRQFARRKLRE